MGSGSGRLGLDQHRHRPGPGGIGGASQHLGAYVPTVSGSSTQIILTPRWLTGWTGHEFTVRARSTCRRRCGNLRHAPAKRLHQRRM